MRNLYFLSLLFAILPLTRSLTIPQLKSCEDVLKMESSEKWSNVASITSIFYHVSKTGCLICSEPKCANPKYYCNKESEIIIPMYNNLFEFGLSGKYFPEGGSITINYKQNDTCYLKILLFQDREKKKFGLDFNQCYVHTFSKEKRCFPESKRIEYFVNFDNQFCLYFGLAFVEGNQVFLTTSPHCNKIASDSFDYEYPVIFKQRSCYFNKDEDKPRAKIELRQSDSRVVEGVPVILPCSPGGFVVDPKSGRFVINEICWKMFSDSKKENVGINFLINKVYNGNENLVFPSEDYSSEKNMRPIYMNSDGTAKSREMMKNKIEPNKLKGNRKRVICEYLETDEIPYISMTEFPATASISNGTNNTASTVKPATRHPRDVKGPPCSNILNGLKPTKNGEKAGEEINTYIHGEDACFVCAEPKCDYTNLDCPLEAEKQIPIYNNLFEFGLSGKYMPEKSDVQINLNDKCYLKLETFITLGNVSFFMQECRTLGKDLEDECKKIHLVGYQDKVLLNNWYCPQIALALHVNNIVFYAFSFRCDKFASSQLNETIFEWLRFEECYTNRKLENMNASFLFKQGELYTTEGVPLMLPCSPGGYAVNTKNGLFTINQTCDDIFWETKVNTTAPSGIHFILKSLFKNNENLQFKSRKDVTTKYPSPIYVRESGKFRSAEEMVPVFKNNSELWRKYREKCIYKRDADFGKPILDRNTSKIEDYDYEINGNISKALKFQLPYPGFILILFAVVNF